MNYTVLMGDIVKSRRYDRYISDAQELLRVSLNYLNKTFKRYIKAEARLQRGDEFQVLLIEPYVGFLFYRLLEMLIYPIKIRCAMFSDEIYDEYFTSTERMSGNAYYEAGSLLDICKENAKSFLFGSKYIPNIDNDIFVINAMADMRSSVLARGNSRMNNNVQIVAETLFPLTLHSERIDNLPNISLLRQIFELKQKIYEHNYSLHVTPIRYSYSKMQQEDSNSDDYGKVNFEVLEDICNEPHFSCGVLDAYKNDRDYLSSCWKRGYNVTIAQILNVSRQTVDRAMSYLDYAEKRNYDGTIIALLKRFTEERYV